MGSVAQVRISGDNDEPIYPTRYAMRFGYCDECGSFDIKHWTEPHNHQQLDRVKTRLNQGIVLMVILLIGSVLLGGGPVIYFWGLGIGLAGIGSVVLGRTIQDKGVRCMQCGTTYEYRGEYFRKFDENPRNFSMEDVPLPLNLNYQKQGEILGRVDEE